MNNEIRNILFDLSYLRKILNDVEMEKQTKDNKELLEQITKGAL